MNSRGITVKVLNYAKFKGRTDVKHNTWFRCSNRLLEDPDFFDFNPTEFLVWIYVMSLSSQKNSDTVFINFSHAEKVCRLKKKDVLSSLKKLEGNQIVPVDVTDAVRARNVDDTHTCATLQNKTVQDITEQDNTLHPTSVGPTDEPEIHWLANLWNSHVPSLPKIRSVGKERIKSITKRLLERSSYEEWAEIMKAAEASDFLTGRDGKWANCSFDWLLANGKDGIPNHIKVFEGNYRNKAGQYASTQQQLKSQNNALLMQKINAGEFDAK